MRQIPRGFQQLEALPPTQEAAVLEHVPTHGMQGPITALSGAVRASGDLDEAVVKGQVVAEGVLPALSVLSVERKVVHDELVDLVQRQHLLVRTLNRHGSQGNVGVGRLLLLVAVSTRSRHGGVLFQEHSVDCCLL